MTENNTSAVDLRDDLQNDIPASMNGTQLRAIRMEQVATIEEFSKRLGVSWVTLWRKEKGRSPISKSLAMAIDSLVAEYATPAKPIRRRKKKIQ